MRKTNQYELSGKMNGDTPIPLKSYRCELLVFETEYDCLQGDVEIDLWFLVTFQKLGISEQLQQDQ